MPHLTWFPHVITFMKHLCLSVKQVQPQNLWLNLQLLVTFVFSNPGQPAKHT